MQPASLRTVSLGGTKRKLMNWKGTQRYQLVTTTLAQSCCSFALTAPAPFSAVVSLERGGEGGGSEWRDEPVSMHWHASLDAQGEDECQEGGRKEQLVHGNLGDRHHRALPLDEAAQRVVPARRGTQCVMLAHGRCTLLNGRTRQTGWAR